MPTSEKGMKMELTAEMKSIASGNLSATTIKVRDAVIQKCEGKNLDEMTQFIKQLLEHETNEQKRLGVLAARVYLLREKILLLKDDDFDDDSAENIKSRHKGAISNDSEESESEETASEQAPEEGKKKNVDWMRVKITENSEVNGIRFPSGVTIDVIKKDAEKLIAAGKAEKVQSGDDDAQEAEASNQDDEKSSGSDAEDTVEASADSDSQASEESRETEASDAGSDDDPDEDKTDDPKS
jgi:hypothetical protein